MLKIGYGGYGLDLFGGYAHPTDARAAREFASFFAFGVLHAPDRRRRRRSSSPASASASASTAS